jgi:hypothetical protein
MDAYPLPPRDLSGLTANAIHVDDVPAVSSPMFVIPSNVSMDFEDGNYPSIMMGSSSVIHNDLGLMTDSYDGDYSSPAAVMSSPMFIPPNVSMDFDDGDNNNAVSAAVLIDEAHEPASTSRSSSGKTTTAHPSSLATSTSLEGTPLPSITQVGVEGAAQAGAHENCRDDRRLPARMMDPAASSSLSAAAAEEEQGAVLIPPSSCCSHPPGGRVLLHPGGDKTVTVTTAAHGGTSPPPPRGRRGRHRRTDAVDFGAILLMAATTSSSSLFDDRTSSSFRR